MVNVPAHVAHLLVQGVATQVRLPISRPRRLDDGRTVPAPCPFGVGDDYPVHPIHVTSYTIGDREYTHREHDPQPLGRVRVLEITQTRLGDLDYEDARREGYRTGHWRDDLLHSWQTHRGDANPDAHVWVLRVEPHHDVVRNLARAGHPVGKIDPHDPERWHGPEGSEIGYTASGYQALPHEPEAVDPATVDRRWTHHAHQRHAEARTEHETQRQRRVLLKRLGDELRAAETSGLDLTADLATLARQVEQMRSRRETRHDQAA